MGGHGRACTRWAWGGHGGAGCYGRTSAAPAGTGVTGSIIMGAPGGGWEGQGRNMGGQGEGMGGHGRAWVHEVGMVTRHESWEGVGGHG